MDMEVAKRESPSTDRFFSIEAISISESDESRDFKENLTARVGISD